MKGVSAFSPAASAKADGLDAGMESGARQSPALPCHLQTFIKRNPAVS
jgi:hypothetical protein